MKKFYSDETKIQTVQEFINGKSVSKIHLKPEYQEVLYILGLNHKRKHLRKQKRLTSETIVSL